MRHTDIWKAVDALAEQQGLSLLRVSPSAPGSMRRRSTSPSAPARMARPRWLSTESLMKALDAVGTSLEDFAALAEGRQGHTAPLLGFAKAGSDGYFDDAGFPVGDGWEEVRFPGLETEAVYALEITGDSMEPVYRRGDRIVVAPGVAVRRGDRVVARTRRTAKCSPRCLGRLTERTVELISLNPAYRAARAGARAIWPDGPHPVGEPVDSVLAGLRHRLHRCGCFGVGREESLDRKLRQRDVNGRANIVVVVMKDRS